MNARQPLALVLGGNGGVGAEVTRALLRRGWLVRALVRKQPKVTGEAQHRHLQWRIGDALCRQDVLNAAQDADVIVHAVNPAKYHNWRGLALPMLDNSIAAAEANRSRILLPGTLYNFGRDAFPLVDELSPQNPHTRKGAIRVEMEERLRDASWDGRVRALIVRSGDFFGPRAGSSWFSQGLVMPNRSVRFVLNPGPGEIYHSWAYLPDVAETMARLLEQENTLQKFDSFHFKGRWLSNAAMASVICNIADICTSRVLSFPWWAIRATAPLVELSNEMQEMRYLWNEPLELNNAKLRERLGHEPQTAIEHAVRATLIGMGCMPPEHRSAATAGTF